MKSRILLLSALILSVSLSGQEFKTNSVGLIFLRCERVHTYELEIVFPMSCVSGLAIEDHSSEFKTSYPGVYNQNGIFLFDQKGILGQIEISNYIFKMWCENDGGFHYRPTFQGAINKASLKRPLKAIQLYDIACFALINSRYESRRFKPEKREMIVTSGDMNSDGLSDVLLWLQPDEAKSCEGDQEYWLMLEFNGSVHQMNCCGP